MASQLTEYWQGHTCKGFHPHPFISKDGDFLTYFFRDCDYYAERVDDYLTEYHANDTGEVIGVKVKGIRHLFDALGEYELWVWHDGELMLSMLINAGLTLTKEPEVLPRYQRLMRDTNKVRLRREEFEYA